MKPILFLILFYFVIKNRIEKENAQGTETSVESDNWRAVYQFMLCTLPDKCARSVALN